MPAPKGTGKRFDKFSILYETQLEGHPLMGYLGTGFLNKYRSVIDVPESPSDAVSAYGTGASH